MRSELPPDNRHRGSCPLPPADLAAREWPTLRAACIDIAAALDRLDAVGDAEATAAVRQQVEDLLKAVLTPTEEADRAERLLTLLSRDYDPGWKERFVALADPSIASSEEP